MYDLNIITLYGRVSFKNEPKEVAGKKCIVFGIANSPTGKEDNTSYINCTAWDRLAEVVDDYVSKGDAIVIVGYLEVKKIEKDGISKELHQVVVSKVQLLGYAKTQPVPQPVLKGGGYGKNPQPLTIKYSPTGDKSELDDSPF